MQAILNSSNFRKFIFKALHLSLALKFTVEQEGVPYEDLQERHSEKDDMGNIAHDSNVQEARRNETEEGHDAGDFLFFLVHYSSF